MAGLYGPADAFLFVDGYDLSASHVKSFTDRAVSAMEDTTGIGDSWRVRSPVGSESSEITIEGAVWDTNTTATHSALNSRPTSAQATLRIICFGRAGQTIGNEMVGIQGAFTSEYEVVADDESLTKANVTVSVDGSRDAGVILQELEAKTADWNTEAAESYDGTAQSTAGGVGYLQCTAASGFTNFVGKITDSADDVTFGDLLTFTDNVTAPFAERVTVSGTVERYLGFDGNVTGAGSITVFCGFSRS